MRRGLAVLAALLLLLGIAICLVGRTASFRSWLAHRVERALEAQIDRQVVVRLSRIDLARLRFEIAHLEVAGRVPEGPPAVTLDDSVLDLRWRSLSERRLDASELSLRHLRLDVEELPSAEPSTSPALSAQDLFARVRIDRLSLEDGSLSAGAETATFDLLLTEVGLEATYEPLGALYRGRLRVGGGWIRLPQRGELPVEIDTAITLDAAGLELADLHAALAGAEVTGHGRLTFGEPVTYVADLAAELPAELLTAESPSHPNASPQGLSGTFLVSGRIEGTGAEAAAELEIGARQGFVAGMPVERLSGHLSASTRSFELTDVVLDLPGARLSGRFASRGTVSWLPAEGTFDLASGNVAPLCRRLTGDPTVPCPAGPVGGRLTLQIEEPASDGESLEGLSARLTLASEALRLADGTPWSLEAEAVFSGSDGTAGEVTLSRFDLTTDAVRLASGGRIALGGEVDLESTVRLEPLGRAIGQFVELADALGAAPGGATANQTAALGGALSGTVRLRGPTAGNWRTLTGTADLELEQATLEAAGVDRGAGGGSSPWRTDGRLHAVLESGRVELRDVALTGGGLQLDASGRIGWDGVDELTAELSMADVGPLFELATQLGLDLPKAPRQDPEATAPAAAPARSPVGGVLHGRLSASGAWRELDGEAELTIDQLATAGLALGQLRLHAQTERGDLRANAELTAPAGGLLAIEVIAPRRFAQGTIHLASTGLAVAPLARLAEQLGAPWPDLTGQVDGEADASWGPGPAAREAAGHLTWSGGRFGGLPIEELSLDAELSANRLRLTTGRLKAAGGELTISGRIGADSAGLDLAGTGFELAALLAGLGAEEDSESPTAIGLDGRLDLAGRLSGSLDAPVLATTLEIGGATMFGRSVPPLAGTLSADSGGVRLDLAGIAEATDVRLHADFGLGDDAPWTAKVRYPLRLDLAAFGAEEPTAEAPLPERGAPQLTAQAMVEADLAMAHGDLSTLRGSARLEDVELDSAGYALRAADPIEIRIEGAQLRVAKARLVGDGTSLQLSASGTLGDDPSLQLSSRGSADLRLLSGWDPRLRAVGAAELDLSATLDGPAIDWQGKVEVKGARLVHSELPAPLEEIRATIELSADTWRLTDLAARVGGGTAAASGTAHWAGAALRDYHFDVTGDDVRLTYPEGFRSQLNADLVVESTERGSGVLSGRIDLEQGVWEEDFEIERQILRRSREFEAPTDLASSWLDDFALDVEVHATDSLYLRNDLADLESRADVRVGGTLRHPAPNGRIQVLEGGRATFRRVEYQINRGSLSFLGSTDPVLDFEGETTVEEYDIFLTVSGPLSDPAFELRSVPSLPRSDIVTLLVTGRTRDELAAGGGGLSDAEAAAYLTHRLSDSVLPELRRSLGLDELRVDPVLVADEADPVARVTVGKELSDRATATYSRELGNGGGDIYQLRYRLDDHWFVQGTRDDDGSVAADVRLRARRYIGPERPHSTDATDTTAKKIGSLTLRADADAPREKLEQQLGISRGDRYRRARLLDGLDAIRSWYVERGYPEVEVDPQVDESGPQVAIVVEVRRGRRIDVAIEGFDGRRRLRREVLRAWQQAVFRDEVVEQGRRAVESYLRERGYLFSTVAVRQEETASDALRLVFEVNAGPRVRVGAIEIHGREEVARERIEAQMLTQPSRFFDRVYLMPSLLDDDVEAIRALYQSEGFLDAEVESQIDDSASKRDATVVLSIAEGRRYRLSEPRFSGNVAFPASELVHEIDLAAGQVFDPQNQRAAEAEIQRVYDARGYPQATVRSRLEIDRGEGLVGLEFEIHEGPPQKIAEVAFEGLAKSREATVRHLAGLEIGEPVSERRLAEARHDLYGTGLFRSVDFGIEPMEGDEERRIHASTEPPEESAARRVVFRVEEAPNVRLDATVGADSVEGPRVGGEVAETNLFGRGILTSLSGRWSRRDRRAQFLLRDPHLLGSSLGGLVSLFWEDEQRESFRAKRLGFGLRATRTWNEEKSTFQWGYNYEDLRLVEDDFSTPGASGITAESKLALASLGAGLSHDGRDAPFWPTHGWLGRSEVRLHDEALLSDAEFVRGFGQINYYHPVLHHGVYAVAVRLGGAEPQAAADIVPVSERFFLGGDSSLRGFAIDSVVPLGFPGDAEAARRAEESPGGYAIFAINQELLLPFKEPFHIVAFYDAGNLYWRIHDFDPSQLRHAAGLGLRIRTPVGPLRVEYGWKLDRQEGESSGELHLSIGVPF